MTENGGQLEPPMRDRDKFEGTFPETFLLGRLSLLGAVGFPSSFGGKESN